MAVTVRVVIIINFLLKPILLEVALFLVCSGSGPASSVIEHALVLPDITSDLLTYLINDLVSCDPSVFPRETMLII